MVLEITIETTQVFETFETDLSTALLPLSVSIVLGLCYVTTNVFDVSIFFISAL
jgi:hypothetical protein